MKSELTINDSILETITLLKHDMKGLAIDTENNNMKEMISK